MGLEFGCECECTNQIASLWNKPLGTCTVVLLSHTQWKFISLSAMLTQEYGSNTCIKWKDNCLGLFWWMCWHSPLGVCYLLTFLQEGPYMHQLLCKSVNVCWWRSILSAFQKIKNGRKSSMVDFSAFVPYKERDLHDNFYNFVKWGMGAGLINVSILSCAL